MCDEIASKKLGSCLAQKGQRLEAGRSGKRLIMVRGGEGMGVPHLNENVGDRV